MPGVICDNPRQPGGVVAPEPGNLPILSQMETNSTAQVKIYNIANGQILRKFLKTILHCFTLSLCNPAC